MLFRSLLEAHSENGDAQLADLERELKTKIERARNLATNLKATSDSDDQSFSTSTSGVTPPPLRI